MKKRTINRGLYTREIRSYSSDDDSLMEAFETLSGDLDRYVANARDLAIAILSDAGFDAESLFKPVEGDDGSRYLPISRIDRESLSPELDQALRLLDAAHRVEGDLAGTSRDSLWRGIHLAQSFEQLKANLVWQSAVRGYLSSRRKSALLQPVRATVARCKAERVKPTGAEVARRLQLVGVEISERHARDLVKQVR